MHQSTTTGKVAERAMSTATSILSSTTNCLTLIFLLPFASLTRCVGCAMFLPLLINFVLLFRFNSSGREAWISSSEALTFGMLRGTTAGDTTTTKSKPPLHLRPFLSDPALHNKTVSGRTMPGLFANDRLFLLGAHLTPHYEKQDVHIDLFGFPGDWFTRFHFLSDGPGCTAPGNDTTPYQHMLHYPTVLDRVHMFCQVECAQDGTHCGDPIPMEFIPLHSGDHNQNETTLIWRCNVTQHVTKRDLQQAANDNVHRALRTIFWMQQDMDKNDNNKDNENDIAMNKEEEKEKGDDTESSKHRDRVALVDLPLRTGVVGHAGPQMRGASSTNHTLVTTPSYLTEPNMDVGLCVDVYGKDTLKYLPEFVQHHKNVGVDQIVIGVEATLDSEDLLATRDLLRPYLEEGFVVLAAVGLRDFFDCYFDFHKLHFYHQCMYHFKGVAKYSATWDVDEFWLPPSKLEISGLHKENHLHEGGEPFEVNHTGTIEGIQYLTKSNQSSFSPLLRNDPVWRESRYAKSVSIRDVMSAVDQYYSQIGCANRWCYHLFPSLTTHLHREMFEDDTKRTHRHIHDFHKRDEEWNSIWRKGVANTKYTMMGGIHTPGSCRFDGDDTFHEFSGAVECRPHLFAPEVYGSIHHFLSMMLGRYDVAVLDKTHLPEDEYVKLYGKTVNTQLLGIYGNGDKSSSTSR